MIESTEKTLHYQRKRSTLLEELMLIKDTLDERAIKAWFYQTDEGKNIFISHSSKDKDFAVQLVSSVSHFAICNSPPAFFL